jgi:hypothetical protein
VPRAVPAQDGDVRELEVRCELKLCLDLLRCDDNMIYKVLKTSSHPMVAFETRYYSRPKAPNHGVLQVFFPELLGWARSIKLGTQCRLPRAAEYVQKVAP